MLLLPLEQAVFRHAADPSLLRWIADTPEQPAVLEFFECADRLAGATVSQRTWRKHSWCFYIARQGIIMQSMSRADLRNAGIAADVMRFGSAQPPHTSLQATAQASEILDRLLSYGDVSSCAWPWVRS